MTTETMTARDKLYLTDDQLYILAEQFAEGMKPKGQFTTEQFVKVVEWARDQVIGYAMLQLVLKRQLVILVDDDGEIALRKGDA